jgi:alkyl hydroperoxide reductase subunit F
MTFSVTTSRGQKFTSKTLVITAGKTPRTLGIPGEKTAMQGNGLSFCATCDAPIYTGKKMAIIGGGNSSMDVALQLETLTDDITIFTDLPTLIGEGVLMEKVQKSSTISVKYSTQAREILLDEHNHVRGIRYTENGGKEKKFACEGIFEEIGHIPATEFLRNFEGLTLNEKEEIVTDRRCRTSLPGVFAAGDVTDQAHKQIIVAAGEGAVAALEAHEFLLNS